jgi:hypothetical protein
LNDRKERVLFELSERIRLVTSKAIQPTTPSRWIVSHRADKEALPLADRHYNRQKVGSPQFVPPGRCLVLLSECKKALWVTTFPFAEYVHHGLAHG